MSDRSSPVMLNGVTLPQQMVSSCTGALLVSLFMTPLDVDEEVADAADRLAAAVHPAVGKKTSFKVYPIGSFALYVQRHVN